MSASDSLTAVRAILGQLACPVCLGELALAPDALVCTQCARQYEIQDGIPILIPEPASLKI